MKLLKTIVLIFLLSNSFHSFAQLEDAKLSIRSQFLGEFGLMVNDQVVSKTMFRTVLAQNDSALALYNNAQKYHYLGLGATIGAGVCLAATIVIYAQEKPISPYLLVGGLALASATIPLSIMYSRRMEKAVNVYNTGRPYTKKEKVSSDVSLSPLGFRYVLFLN